MKPYILLVEDDKFISDLMAIVLRHEKYKVKIAPDHKTAIRLFDKQLPDLILLDYLIPGDPVELFVKHVRKKSKVPIIMVTAITNAEAVAEALEISDLIKKPFDIEELLNKVNRCLDRSCPPEMPLSI